MKATFRDLIAQNKRQSVILVVLFCLFVTVVASVLGVTILVMMAPPNVSQKLNWQEGVLVGLFAAGLSFGLSLIGYYSGDSMILGVSGAKPLRHADDPELVNVVEEMAIAAGVPPPKIYLINDEALNAFATGRDPEHAAVAITTGLREKLSRDELQGVIAHEMSHIRNYDIRLMLLLAVLIGTVVMLCDFFWQIIRFSPGRSDSDSNRRSEGEGGKGGNPLIVVLIVVAVILAIVAPILAQLIQLAVSRQREYLADATAVQLTRYPQGLANALHKLANDPLEVKNANRGTAHLYITNPIKKFQDKSESMFASHPPLKDRIRRLEALA